MGLERVWELVRRLRVSRDDELTCMIHALQERCEELEARVSLLEDEVNLPGLHESDGLRERVGEGQSRKLAALDAEDADWEGEIEDDEDEDPPLCIGPKGRGV